MTSIPSASAPERLLRVFISSTFRDMHAEREELMKQVFPLLRKLCEQRGITWGEVDLRWGITEEQRAEGKVLPICLAEIENCRPYFIGLLGERYGWIPQEIPPELVEAKPWLAGQGDRSVTELEILHGVLNNPEMAGHAFFYFRSPSCLDSLPEDMQSAYREVCTPEEVSQFGQDEASRRAAERQRKLASLKERIRASGFPVHENFKDSRALGQLVLEDLTQVVERLFPPDAIPDPLDREALEHLAFARSRAQVYIGRSEYFDRLDAHVSGDGPPLVVSGESGSGKSALLANWPLRRRLATHPAETPPLIHFIGATHYSADWTAMLARLVSEINRRFDLHQTIPEEPDALRRAFASSLDAAAAKGKLVIVLDALDQIEDRDGAPDLVWLPEVIPANVRLVVSTLPGRARDEITRRQWPSLEVLPLRPGERFGLVQEYLGRFTKTLAAPSVAKITSAGQTANPLYLRQLLDELRQHGDHLTIGKRIDQCLEARNAAELFARVLDRYEADYERDRPGLVRDVMSHLWAARRGLSEAELLDLLGTGGEALPRAYFSPLHLAIESSLVVRSGLTGFFHRHLREAVRERYLPGEAEKRSAHLRLAEYFKGRELDVRKREELPWQLAEAGAWEPLAGLLTQPSFFEALWRANASEVKSYWSRIESNSPIRMASVYKPLFDTRELNLDYVRHVGFLFRHMSHLDEAKRLHGVLLERGRESGDIHLVLTSMGNQANSLFGKGNLLAALELYEEIEQMVEEQGGEFEDSPKAQHLGNKASVLARLGREAEALQMRFEEERLFRLRGDLSGLTKSLIAQVGMLLRANRPVEATARCAEAERISRQLGDQMLVALALHGKSDVLQAQGDAAGALVALEQQTRICREIGDLTGLYGGLSMRAQLLLAKSGASQADRDEARGALEEAEQVTRRANDSNLRLALYQHAHLLAALGEVDAALSKYSEAEQIFRAIGDSDTSLLATVIEEKAQLLCDQGNVEAGLDQLREAETLYRKLGREVKLAQCIRTQTGVLWKRDRASAVGLMPELADIYRRTHKNEELKQVLFLQASYFKSINNFEQTEALLPEHDELCKGLNDQTGLAASREIRDSMEATRLCLSAIELAQQGREADALPVFQRAVELTPDYGTCWSDMGICLLELKRYAEAEAALTRALEFIPRDLVNWSKLGTARLLQLNFAGTEECLAHCRAIAPDDHWTTLLAAMLKAVRKAAPEKKAPWWKFWND
jgi:tetratricopeptide (TPR) repeat protein